MKVDGLLWLVESYTLVGSKIEKLLHCKMISW